MNIDLSSIINILSIFTNPIFLIFFSISMLFVTLISFLTFGRLWFKKHILRQSYVDCRILKEYGDSFKVISQKYVNVKNQTFTIDNDKEYIINLNEVLLKRNLEPILYYDIEDSKPISIRKLSDKEIKKHSPKLLKTVVTNRVLSKLFSSTPDTLLVIICICLAVGMVAITIFSFYQINQLQEQIIKLVEELAKRPPPIIPD